MTDLLLIVIIVLWFLDDHIKDYVKEKIRELKLKNDQKEQDNDNN